MKIALRGDFFGGGLAYVQFLLYLCRQNRKEYDYFYYCFGITCTRGRERDGSGR